MARSNVREAPADPRAEPCPFDLVILAASAGGIEAIGTVLRRLRPGFPAPILILQHLRTQTAMVDVLARSSELDVQWAEDGARLEAGTVLVAPPLSAVHVRADGTCRIKPTPALRRPIDTALAIAAAAVGPRLLVVILTGMLNDGAEGVRAVKAHGGTVIVQSEDSAEQPAMPHAAIATGVVDLIVPLSDLAAVVTDVVRGRPPHSDQGEVDSVERLFPGDAVMAGLLRAVDWSKTSLGPAEAWPPELRAAVRQVLASGFAACLHWGPELVQIYNDPFIEILGSKHPGAVARPAADTWSEVWPELYRRFEQVERTRLPVFEEDALLFPNIRGLIEEQYYTFGLAPVASEAGAVGGVVMHLIDTTARVLAVRRLRVLHALASHTSVTDDVRAAAEVDLDAMAADREDMPFAVLYMVTGAARTRATLTAAMGIEPGAEAAPMNLDLDAARPFWPIGTVIETDRSSIVGRLRDHLKGIDAGPYDEPPDDALVLPIHAPGDDAPAGALVVGLSPRRLLDGPYRAFLEAVASQVAATLADALSVSRDRERLRALGE